MMSGFRVIQGRVVGGKAVTDCKSGEDNTEGLGSSRGLAKWC